MSPEERQEWLEERKKGVGGSDMTIIMGDDKEALNRLWRIKRGEEQDEDLSDVLPVQMGVWTEPFNALWFEKVTGKRVISRGDVRVSPEHPWMRCSLDGEVSHGALMAVWEAKHVSAFAKEDEVVRKYHWQLQHCMAVTGAVKAYLSVFFGTLKHAVFEVDADPLSQAQLIAAGRAFWACVETGDPPVVINVPAPVEAVKRVDMTGNNAWADSADKWLKTKGYAKTFETATKAIKELVDADVIEASGHGITASRSKAGAITIRETK